MEKNACMAETYVIKAEIARGEQDNVFEEYLQSERKKMRDKLRSKVSAIRIANNVSSSSASPRIVELARPTRQHALNTLNEKATTLPPKCIENLIKIVGAKSCSTPERARRRKKRRTKKATRSPQSFKKKQIEEIVDDVLDSAVMMDPDAAMYQYLIAKHFVKSILEYQRETQEGIREIADVIMKRLTSMEGYSDAKNDVRMSQQLRLLADVVSRWITEILEEVIKTHGEVLNNYKKKRWMKRLEVSEEESEESQESITENWKQTDQTKEKSEEVKQFDNIEATIVKEKINDDEDEQKDEEEVTRNNQQF